jgi:hypothetical protein
MLNLKKVLGAIALVALFALIVTVIPVPAHAQGCWVPLHPEGHVRTFIDFYGNWVNVWEPCRHFFNRCR